MTLLDAQQSKVDRMLNKSAEYMQSYQQWLVENPAEAAEAETLFVPQEAPLNCHICGDRLIIEVGGPQGHPLLGQRIPCPCCEGGRRLQENEDLRMFGDVRVPPEYAGYSFATWNSKGAGKPLALAAAHQFVYSVKSKRPFNRKDFYKQANMRMDGPDHSAHSLVLQGTYGVGKTGLAMSCRHALREQGILTLYIRVQTLVQDIQESYKDGYLGPTRRDMVARAQAAPVLILDEMNMSSVSDHTEDVVQEIIRHRHSYQLPTIVTCNWSKEQMKQVWGGWIMSVLLQMAHWIEMDGVVLRAESPVSKEAV